MPTRRTGTSAASVTVLGRLAKIRGLTAYFILLVAAPVLVGLAARQAYVRLQLPDVGLMVNSELRVEASDARWAGVKQWDRVVALDGVDLKQPSEWVSRALAHDAKPLTVRFEREGKQWTQTASATPIALTDQIAVWARVATGAALMLMGLVVFLLRPGVPVTWILLLLAWDLGLFLLLKIGLYFDPALYKQATVIPWAAATSLGLHFLCYFPERIPWIADRPRRAIWLYIPLLLAPLAQSDFLESRVRTVATLWGAVTTVLVLGIVGLQYRRVRRGGDDESRSQYRALAVGFSLGLLIPGVWNWLRIALDVWNGPWAAHYNALPMVLFVAVVSYAVVRHNPLDIDRFTATVVGYGVTSIVIGGFFAVLLVAIPLLLDESGLAQSPALLVVVTALTFAGFTPAYRRIKRWVDRRFFRERADAAQIADALRGLVVAMQHTSRDEAVQAAFDAAKTLSCTSIELWLLSGNARVLKRVRREGVDHDSERPDELPLDAPLAVALKMGVTAGVEDLAPRVMEANAQDQLWSLELAMAAPVMIHGALAGFLAVGRKRSGARYVLEELSLLTLVAAQLASVLERSEAQNTRLGQYHLERRLGTGGMAEVYLAWQVGPGGFERKVAIKRPLPHVSEDPNAEAAFLDEARLAAQLQHPNVVQVYDVGQVGDSYFIVMEYVDGPSLRQVLRQMRHGVFTMPFEVAASVVLGVLSALHYAHHFTDPRGRALELVHRDVTPRNVLLNRSGDVKLVDFGIARAQFQLHVTRTGTIKGTLPYMSPEQAGGKPVDQRSDLYSAAALLYELLTGVTAYPRGPSARRPQPASSLSQAPKALDGVLRKAMALDPDARYASADQLAQAIVECIRPAEPASSAEVARWLAETCPEQMSDEPSSAVGLPPPSRDEESSMDLTASDEEVTVAEPRRSDD